MTKAEQARAVGWRDDAGKPREAVIRMPLKDISVQLDLDAEQFV